MECAIHAPDMVWMKRSQPDGRAILVVQSAALLVPIGQLQALLAPDPFGLLVIDPPAFNPQELGHRAIAIAAIPLRQADQRETQFGGRQALGFR